MAASVHAFMHLIAIVYVLGFAREPNFMHMVHHSCNSCGADNKQGALCNS